MSDRSFADPAPEVDPEVEIIEQQPEGFDFAEWLSGIQPIRARFNLFGQELTLCSRSSTWRKKFEKRTKGWSKRKQDAAFLAGHIVSPEVTADQMEQLLEQSEEHAREGDVNALVRLIVNINTLPVDQIDERFLLPASD